jgi:L-alanine-DL-glutamate epimerase-like enolase superfamily enzyme
MKITKVETLVVNMPMVIEGPVVPQQGGRPRTSMDTLLVRVETDGGVTGWGEGFGHRIFPATKAAVDSLVGPMCVGRDPTAISALADDLQRNLAGVGRNGPAMYALSAIDIALWDIAGKLAGLPLYRLLGGPRRERLPAYASLLRYGDPPAVARYTERALKRGYRHIKLHEITLAPIRAAREAAGPEVSIMVDCNCPWTVAEAIAMARKLRPLDLKWLEEPVWPPEDHAGLARVQEQGGIPTAAGENAMLPEFRGLLAAGAIAYAQPSVTKVGGVTQMRKVAALAEAHGVDVVPHSAYFGPGLLASIHCIAAMARESLVERYDADFAVNPLHGAILPDGNGFMPVPQGPGLGVDPDPAVVAKLRVG